MDGELRMIERAGVAALGWDAWNEAELALERSGAVDPARLAPLWEEALRDLISRADAGRRTNLVPYGNLVVQVATTVADHLRSERKDKMYDSTTKSGWVVGFMSDGKAQDKRDVSAPATSTMIVACVRDGRTYVTVGAAAMNGPNYHARSVWPELYDGLLDESPALEAWAAKRSEDRVTAPLEVVEAWLGPRLTRAMRELSELPTRYRVCSRVASTMTHEELAALDKNDEDHEAKLAEIREAVTDWGERRGRAG